MSPIPIIDLDSDKEIIGMHPPSPKFDPLFKSKLTHFTRSYNRPLNKKKKTISPLYPSPSLAP